MLHLADYIAGVRSGELDSEEVLQSFLAKAMKNELNTWITIASDYIVHNKDNLRSQMLCGAPIGLKDNIMTSGVRTTCASKILESYVPDYSATCFERLENAGALLLGKNNMDEFAMGGSGENSAFGPTKNPYDNERISGGSSSGGAVAVANGECLGALGTDTGGSVRQPASFCNVVGFKPTYGNISRYGVQSMSNSLDQVGVIANTVEDTWLLYSSIAGYDPMDLNAREDLHHNPLALFPKKEGRKPKICVFKEFFSEGIDPMMKQVILEKIDMVKSQGYEVEYVSFPLLQSLIATYYIICPAEVSTNLARFDGLRYGLQQDTALFDTISDYYSYIRSHGFGKEVQRRILIGAHVLSSGFQDQYYNKAIAIKNQVTSQLLSLFECYDVVLGPVSPVRPWKIGGHAADPLQDYLADAYTIVANLTQSPAMSVPAGFVEIDGSRLPYGLHIMAKPGSDENLFVFAQQLQNIIH